MSSYPTCFIFGVTMGNYKVVICFDKFLFELSKRISKHIAH